MLSDGELDILRGQTDNPETLKAIAQMDRRRGGERLMCELGVDTRVWPIVLGIRDNPTSQPECVGGGWGKDIMGMETDWWPERTRGGRKTGGKKYSSDFSIGGVRITRKGWDIAMPHVQKALDLLSIPFDAGFTKLVCKLGTYKVERIYTDDDGYQFRMFDMGHGASGFSGSCYPLFPKRKPTDDGWVGSWSRILRLPESKELVKIDGWGTCMHCSAPIRPRAEATK